MSLTGSPRLSDEHYWPSGAAMRAAQVMADSDRKPWWVIAYRDKPSNVVEFRAISHEPIGHPFITVYPK